MKLAANALRTLLARVATDVGLEGAFLIVGTVGLAWAASFLHPAGAIAVVSLMCLVVGIALAVPPRNAPGPK